MITALLGILLLALGVDSYKEGVSPFACEDMFPGHYGKKAQSTAAPYKLSVEAEGDNVKKVTLDGDVFKGFFIQAREAREKPGIGEFTVDDPLRAKTFPCFEKNDTALSHLDNAEKTSVTAHWTPPPGFKGAVIFFATVAKNYETFWVNIQSENVDCGTRPAVKTTEQTTTVKETPTTAGKTPTTAEETPTTAKETTTTTEETPTTVKKTTTTEETGHIISVMRRCGDSFGCLGIPSDCVAKGTCSVLLTYVTDQDGVNYRILAPVSANNFWIAAAMSEDDKMDKSTVVECLLVNDQVSMRESWNGDAYSNMVFQNVTKGVTFAGGSYADGMLSCAWHRHHVTKVEKMTFETDQNSYYVLLASGELAQDPERTKKYHSIRGFSAEPVNLNLRLIARDGVDSDLFIKLHGSLMVTAWLFLVSLGILVARYYKDVGGSIQIAGVKLWFFLHRGVMVTAVCMILSALGLIFYKVGGWSPVQNVHPILGIISSALGVCQPIMSLFRCGPDDEHRWIFNRLHWFVGNVAQILAVVTLFLAFGLEKAQLASSDRFLYVLGAFVGFHVFVHVVVHLYSEARGKKKFSFDIKLHDLPVAGGPVPPLQCPRELQATKSSGTGFRLFMLGFYMGVALLAAISLVIIVWVAPASW